MLLANRAAQTGKVNGWGALATGGKIGLFTNNFTPTPDTKLADLVEATFTGYAQVAIGTLSSPYIDPASNQEVIDGANATFIAAAGMTPTVIYGAFIVDTAGTALLGVEKFAAPVNLTEAGQGISYVPTLSSGG